MGPTAILLLIIAAMLAAERIGLTVLTRRPRSCAWIQRHRMVHPNTISIVRMPMGIVAMVLWIADMRQLAILWLAFWMISDLSDGTIARNCDLVSDSGKWLDPLSDKCLYFPPLLYFAFAGPLPAAWITAFVAIDSVGQASRLLIRKKAANMFGKAKTALVTVLIAGTALQGFHQLDLIPEGFLFFLSMTCVVLAFLSLYCKVIPDVWYANSLTFANLVCGLGAIYMLISPELIPGTDRYLIAFLLVFLGQFFDLLDGRLARRFGSTRHGAVFDDIADGTSFGMAIGVLIVKRLGHDPFTVTLAAAYLIAVIYRLIRFLREKDLHDPGIFAGLPSPAGALFAGSSALLFADLRPVAWAMVIAATILMVSRIQYRHFARRIWPELPNILKVSAFVLILIFVNNRLASRTYSGMIEIMCFALAVSYVVLGTDRLSRHLLPTRRPREKRMA